jgi:hypothetical protein
MGFVSTEGCDVELALSQESPHDQRRQARLFENLSQNSFVRRLSRFDSPGRNLGPGFWNSRMIKHQELLITGDVGNSLINNR